MSLGRLSEVERALDALEAQGARSFDMASCDCVRQLITRAEALGGRTAELLAVRAEAHLERLRARFAQARRTAEQRLARAESTHGQQPKLRETLARGDVTLVRRKLRRLATAPIKVAPPLRKRSTAPRPSRHDRADYEESLAELVASFALARAVDVVPEHAGPYNPLRIASDLLARMRTVSPIYLTAQLNRLEELASMLELPEQESKTLPRKKRGALKSGS